MKISAIKRSSKLIKKTADSTGQSTIEFALVVVAFLALLIGFGVMWRAFDEGLFVEHATKSASHHMQLVYPGAIRDVLAY